MIFVACVREKNEGEILGLAERVECRRNRRVSYGIGLFVSRVFCRSAAVFTLETAGRSRDRKVFDYRIRVGG